MIDFLQNFHSGWAYITLLFLLTTIINSAIGLSSKKLFMPRDRKIALFALIFTHIQLLIGLVLYFGSPLGKAALVHLKNPELRLTALEHPLTNLIAVALITIGWSKHKKTTESSKKFKVMLIFYGLGLLLILSRLPWNLWF